MRDGTGLWKKSLRAGKISQQQFDSLVGWWKMFEGRTIAATRTAFFYSNSFCAVGKLWTPKRHGTLVNEWLVVDIFANQDFKKLNLYIQELTEKELLEKATVMVEALLKRHAPATVDDAAAIFLCEGRNQYANERIRTHPQACG
jgi:hypothetical protein